MSQPRRAQILLVVCAADRLKSFSATPARRDTVRVVRIPSGRGDDRRALGSVFLRCGGRHHDVDAKRRTKRDSS
jgi:hypothetical protein